MVGQSNKEKDKFVIEDHFFRKVFKNSMVLNPTFISQSTNTTMNNDGFTQEMWEIEKFSTFKKNAKRIMQQNRSNLNKKLPFFRFFEVNIQFKVEALSVLNVFLR